MHIVNLRNAPLRPDPMQAILCLNDTEPTFRLHARG